MLGWVWGGGCVGIEVGGRGLEKGLIGVWFGARFGLGLRVLDYGLRLDLRLSWGWAGVKVWSLLGGLVGG